jgi:hypothetical protein
MNPIFVVIIILVVALLLAILLKAAKVVLNIIIIIGIVFCIGVLVLGVLIFLDAREFQAKVKATPSKYLLAEQGRILAGLRIDANGTILQSYEGQELSDFSTQWTEENLQTVLGSDFKVFIFDVVSFDPYLEEPINLSLLNVFLSKNETILLLTSVNSSEVIASKLYGQLDDQVKSQITYDDFRINLQARFGSEEKLRAIIFAELLNRVNKERYVLFLMEGMKQGIIVIYPQTLLFTSMEYVPERVFSAAVSEGERGIP